MFLREDGRLSSFAYLGIGVAVGAVLLAALRRLATSARRSRPVTDYPLKLLATT